MRRDAWFIFFFFFVVPPSLRHCRVYNMKIYSQTLHTAAAKYDESIERAFNTRELLSNVEQGAEEEGWNYGKCDNTFESGILPRCTQLYRYTGRTMLE